MHISVVIPAYNEEKLLGSTLAAVASAAGAFTERGWAVEMIVCDNNSTDRTAKIARASGATVVFEPINQIGRARNRGAAIARGDWLVFIDADSLPTQALFADTAEAIASGRIVACGASVRFETLPWWARLLAVMWSTWSRIARHMAGSFIAVEAAAFREIGGFSSSLYAAEELDLSRRLKRFGRRSGRRVRILTRHPLLTSARKLQLYTPRESLRFALRFATQPWRTLASREACAFWYDGRR